MAVGTVDALVVPTLPVRGETWEGMENKSKQVKK